MKTEFKPDIFSNNIPVWNLAGNEIKNDIIGITEFIPIENINFTNLIVEYSGAFEINSSNLRISFGNYQFLLKRWSPKADKKQLQNLLEMMEWLAGKNLPVPTPQRFKKADLMVFYKGHFWSFFPFVEGVYFSGQANELDTLAEMTGILSETLRGLPNELLPGPGPVHLTDSDNDIIKNMESERDNWIEIFGPQYATLLINQWDELRGDWDRLRKERIDAGPIMACHFDLHPHNVLVKNSKISALLDFESCKMLPIGYSFGFNALKQCRQAIVANGNNIDAREIGDNYLTILSNKFPVIKPYIKNTSDLAIIEVLRRLCVIFRFNILEREKIWNHVLPIQLSHLQEAKKLFS